jgi:phenylpyruvate tautomerase PptA (4-oxalocrotonate tautomerase family)
MPLYRCLVAEGLTSFEQRSRIAGEITRIHCETTGGLPGFVHAFFAEDTTGRLPAGKEAVVFGGIRAGRSVEQKQRLVSEMRKAFATIAGRPEDVVLVATADIPARWVMEGGHVLPEPGEEEEWLAVHTRGG